jgi:hypothetical protein
VTPTGLLIAIAVFLELLTLLDSISYKNGSNLLFQFTHETGASFLGYLLVNDGNQFFKALNFQVNHLDFPLQRVLFNSYYVVHL